jgi:SAM-dependent methyltransferase
VRAGYVRDDCRLCLSPGLVQVLQLASTPPANELLREDELGTGQTEFPLGIWRCPSCNHFQLPVVIDPERLFKNYVYVSGTSRVFVDHFRRYAESMFRFLSPGDSVLDVGSNDGTLLRFFKDAGHPVLGVDPAEKIAAEATASGINTVCRFLNRSVAYSILEEYGRFSLVTANNVFAHVDELGALTDAISYLLKPGGMFVFEVSYLVDVCQRTLFDTIYHEHLSYHTIGPLIPFFASRGMSLVDVERVDTHGGSIRCFVRNAPGEGLALPVLNLLHEEGKLGLGSGAGAVTAVTTLGMNVKSLGERLRAQLREIRSSGGKIAGFGAPAKATTLMYEFGLGRDLLDFIVDDSPLKQGLFSPGKKVPILPSSAIAREKPTHLLVLAWNFADSIIRNNAWFSETGGKFIVPLPNLVTV